MTIRPSDLIRRGAKVKGKRLGLMAFEGAVFECKKCGGIIELGADIAYEERDQVAADSHTCKGKVR